MWTGFNYKILALSRIELVLEIDELWLVLYSVELIEVYRISFWFFPCKIITCIDKRDPSLCSWELDDLKLILLIIVVKYCLDSLIRDYDYFHQKNLTEAVVE